MANKPTAAIYNRWLKTLGGGEQTTFAMYETLKKMGYQTSIITPAAVDTQLIKDRFDVTIDPNDVLSWPDCSNSSISKLTQQFELFVNASHFDYPKSQAKHSILCVYFPAQLTVKGKELLKRKYIIPFLQKNLVYVDYQHLEVHERTHRYSYTFNTLPHRVSIRMMFPEFAASIIEQISFSAGLQPYSWTERRVFHHSNRVEYFFDHLPTTRLTMRIPISPYTEKFSLQMWIDDWRYVIHQLLKKKAPKWELRLHGGPEWFTKDSLHSYHTVMANSQFTQQWIRKYWQLDSTVVYPPVPLSTVAETKKHHWITHVGRFFATGHNKKQLQLIRAFRQLIDSGIHGWELHLIGSVEPGDIHLQYVKECQEEAQGYPIFFHFGIPASELRNLLAQSTLYWHATGFDIDEQRQPAFLEHFGMTVVEAMSAGCVPIVIGKGGIPEIITADSGMVWKTLPELIEQTRQLIFDDEKRKQLSVGAKKRALHFSKQKFQKHFAELVTQKKMSPRQHTSLP